MTRDSWLDRVASGEKFDASDVEEILQNWEDEVSDLETAEPVQVIVFDSCRRCGEMRSVDEEGWCSEGCRMGFLPGQWWR